MPKIENGKFRCDCGKILCDVGNNPQDVTIKCRGCGEYVKIENPKYYKIDKLSPKEIEDFKRELNKPRKIQIVNT